MIRLEHVTKDYGATRAVDDVSFSLHEGEIVGFLGPNGAGKSTVLKMVSTWLPPTAGRVEVAGFDTVRQSLSVRRALGYLPEHNALWDDMRVDRLLRFVGGAHGLRGSRLRGRTDRVVEEMSLEAVVRKRVSACSKGYRQRVGLALALIHDPQVLILDEPTHGLDPIQVVAFRDFLRKFRERRTILFSSHILSEVAALSDRILIIHHGRLLCDRPTAELESESRARSMSIEDLVLDIVRERGGANREPV